MVHDIFLVHFEGSTYANARLYKKAIRVPSLARREVIGVNVFDQVLYAVTPEQAEVCKQYAPVVQDLDKRFKYLNVVAADDTQQIESMRFDAFPNAAVIKIKRELIPNLYTWNCFTLFRVRDYKEPCIYRALAKLAAVKLCGSLYVILDAVDISVDAPIITTLID